MHKYLRASGFPGATSEKELYTFISQEIRDASRLSSVLVLEDQSILREYCIPANECIFLSVFTLEIEGTELIQYYYPVFRSEQLSSPEICSVERHTAAETYEAIIDEYKMGMSLIYFVNNPMDYRRRPDTDTAAEFSGSCLTAFANDAIVMLPVLHPENAAMQGLDYQIEQENLREAARNGDEDAIDTLTRSDLDMYNEVSMRVEQEDLYSVVEQTFMPSGVECDQYTVIAEISEVGETRNAFTDIPLILISAVSNDVFLRICLRKEDLLGEPLPGRRIKCRLWLQGHLDFSEPTPRSRTKEL